MLCVSFIFSRNQDKIYKPLTENILDTNTNMLVSVELYFLSCSFIHAIYSDCISVLPLKSVLQLKLISAAIKGAIVDKRR